MLKNICRDAAISPTWNVSSFEGLLSRSKSQVSEMFPKYPFFRVLTSDWNFTDSEDVGSRVLAIFSLERKERDGLLLGHMSIKGSL